MFPQLHHHQLSNDFCNTKCAVLSNKYDPCSFFPSFETKPEKPETKKIMLVLDVISFQQLKESTREKSEKVLWGDPSHKLLKIILDTLVDENTQLYITHALKCEPHHSFLHNQRAFIFTSAKDVAKKEAARTAYEQEKPHFGYCMQYIDKEIEQYDPDIIVTFGHRVTSFFHSESTAVYGSRGLTKKIKIKNKERLLISTVGLREVMINNHLTSQWKVDLGRALWYADLKFKEEYASVPEVKNQIYVNTVNDYKQLIEYLRQSKLPFSYDTETSGLQKIENTCLMMSLSFDGLNAYTIPIQAKQFILNHDETEFIKLTKELFNLPNEKITFNNKFDMQVIAGLYPEDSNWLPMNSCWDVQQLAYVFEENFSDKAWRDEKQPGLTNTRYSWLSLASQVLDILGIYDKQWLGEKENRTDMVGAINRDGWAVVAQYAGKDAIYTYRAWYAYQLIMDRAMKSERDRVAKNLLSRQVYLLTKVERFGLPIDIPAINMMMDVKIKGTVAYEAERARTEFMKSPNVQKYSAMLAAQKPKEARKTLFKTPAIRLSSEEFNINSSVQLAALFFDFMKLKPLGEKRSTDKNFVAKYSDSIKEIALLKTFKERQKVLTAFLPTFKANAEQYRDNRVRANYGLFTTTGRTSCTDPNLQQIPRSGDANNIKGLVKKVIKARPGYAIISADYATAELRVLALEAMDSSLAKVFKNVDEYKKQFLANPSQELFQKLKTDADFHKINASNMMRIPLDKVTKAQRSAAKALSFMIAYAYNPVPNLAAQLSITNEEAQELVDDFLGVYKGVQQWFKDVEKYGREHGYVRSLFGRRRALYGLYGSRQEVGHSLNVNRNSPVQGTASDWTLLAGFDFLKEVRDANVDIRIVNVVHDAIYVECPIDLLKDWVPRLLKTMEQPSSVKALITKEQFEFVPMSADCEIGLDQYTLSIWDDTSEMLDRILVWLKNGADSNNIPLSLYDGEKVEKIEEDAEIPVEEEELEIDV